MPYRRRDLVPERGWLQINKITIDITMVDLTFKTGIYLYEMDVKNLTSFFYHCIVI